MNDSNESAKKDSAEKIKREGAELNKMDYPAGEDIYAQDKKLDDQPGEGAEAFGNNETLFEDPGKDLDVPGAELDDANEAIWRRR
jgi:hypothetical protein